MLTEQNYSKRKKELYEIVELLNAAKTRKDKIKVLQENDDVAVRDYFQCVFDDRVQFALPTGAPPFTASRPESAPSTWRKQTGKLKYIVKGLGAENVLQLKRETIFVGMLEAVDPRDAELLVKMINKEQPTRGVTKKLIQDAYPGLIP